MKTQFRLIAGMLAIVLAGCADPSDPPTQADARWQPEMRLSASGQTGKLSYNFARSIAADQSNNVHAVWYEHSGIILYARSTDGGASWSAPLTLSSVSVPASDPAIAIDGANVYVVWHQTRAQQSEVMLRRSGDVGERWLGEVRLSGSGRAAHSSIAASQGRVYVVWGDVNTGNAEIHSRASLDGGGSWALEQRVSETPYESWVPTVAATGDTVLVGWVDYRDANEEEYVRRSTDGARTWQSSQRLTNDDADSWAPSLAIAGRNAYIAWFDRRDVGITDTELEVALNNVAHMMGLPAAPPPPRTAGAYYLQAFTARFQQRMQQIHGEAAAWVARGGNPQQLDQQLTQIMERFETWANGWEVYYKTSRDGGASWSPDTRLTFAPSMSARPSIALAGDTIHVVWFDSRNDKTNAEIYYKQSPDGGNTWTTDEQLTTAPGVSAHPSVAAAVGRVHVIWFDERSGNPQVWYRRHSR